MREYRTVVIVHAPGKSVNNKEIWRVEDVLHLIGMEQVSTTTQFRLQDEYLIDWIASSLTRAHNTKMGKLFARI